MAYRKRAIPIAWAWVPHVRGHSTAGKQLALLTYVRKLLPPGAGVFLVRDSEFGPVEVLRQAAFGLIHYDLCVDNLIWQGETPTFIDLDDASDDWFAADLAYALRDVCDDRCSRFDACHPAVQAVLAGYRAVRPLDEAWVERLPLFLMNSHLLKYTELLPVVAEAPGEADPEWLRGLHARLASKVAAYREEMQRFVESAGIPDQG